MSVTKILAGLCLAAVMLPALAEEKFKVWRGSAESAVFNKKRRRF